VSVSIEDQSTIYQRPVELLQNLIRFDTTNPPGNEGDCIGYIDTLLTNAGVKTSILSRDPARPNLVARISGKGEAPPLLLYGHVDVKTTENETWRYPPFSGDVAEGCVWGRGALDMKGGVAMMVAAFLRAKAEALEPPGDVILAVVCDEEEGGIYGTKYLVEDHADQFAGVRYAIGEIGGFSFYVGRKKFYPIMVAEKGICRVRAIMRGPSGHPTAAFHGGAMAKLGKVLQQLDRKCLPVHIAPANRLMIQTMSTVLPFPSNLVLRQLLNPKLTDRLLKLLGKQVEQLEPQLHNTVNATAISGADYPRGIPDRIVLSLLCALLPGYGPDDVIAELRPIVGQDIELEIEDTTFFEPGPAEPDMGLFGALADILREADPDGAPIPYSLMSGSDGRHLSRLGIQTYGFTPMQLPPGLRFWELAHAADERIPVESLTFGTDAIYKLLQRFGKQSK